jgi:hypothetical protein
MTPVEGEGKDMFYMNYKRGDDCVYDSVVIDVTKVRINTALFIPYLHNPQRYEFTSRRRVCEEFN